MSDPKNTKPRGDQDRETDGPPVVPAAEPATTSTTWKYIGPKKAASIRFEGDSRLLTADRLSNDQIDRLILEAPHTQAWYEKA